MADLAHGNPADAADTRGDSDEDEDDEEENQQERLGNEGAAAGDDKEEEEEDKQDEQEDDDQHAADDDDDMLMAHRVYPPARVTPGPKRKQAAVTFESTPKRRKTGLCRAICFRACFVCRLPVISRNKLH